MGSQKNKKRKKKKNEHTKHSNKRNTPKQDVLTQRNINHDKEGESGTKPPSVPAAECKISLKYKRPSCTTHFCSNDTPLLPGNLDETFTPCDKPNLTKQNKTKRDQIPASPPK